MKDVIDTGRRRLVLATAALAGGGALASAPAGAVDATPTDQVWGAMRGRWRNAHPDLTVRIVDMLHGVPAEGLRVELSRVDGEREVPLRTATVDARGGTSGALLAGDAYRAGSYVLLLHVDAYYRDRAIDAQGAQPSFLTTVPIRFRIASADQRLHVPVQFGPWHYTYYRGT
ncbi:hydroxyisourate hydrolase [Burkholderia contaminans]|uniref:hydroxyisourate hydrolase n=1 Tax=Burkholderia contaminans TaxID=488447 RepID=UPI001589AA76|nr:hydroxyisourate hydrolase [Burkholderia contaminans]